MARADTHRMVRRQDVLALGELGERSALLDLKDRLDDCQDWEQRAIIFACRKLPADERRAFLGSIRVSRDGQGPSRLRKAVVEYSKVCS
jgi:hypothetical protein